MNGWLLPASIVTLLASILLLIIFAVVYQKDKQEFIALWIAGWALYSSRHAFEAWGIVAPSVVIRTATHEAAALSAVFLLLASLKLITNRDFRVAAIVLSVLLTAWIFTSNLAFDNFLLISLPTFLFFGLVQLCIAYAFYYYNKDKGYWGAHLVTGAMLAWGLHKMNYPFLRNVEWFAPVGFSMATGFEILVGVGVLMMMFERWERRARNAAERFQIMLNNTADAIYLASLPEKGALGNFIEVNDVACQRLGYSKEEFKKMTPKDLQSPRDQRRIPEITKKFFETGHALFNIKHVTKDGTEIPHEINAHLITFEGKPSILAIARDIRGRIDTQKKLREAHERLLTILDSIEAVVYVSDMESHEILYANNYLQNHFGKIEGKICWQVLA